MDGKMQEQPADWLHGVPETDGIAGVSLRSGQIVGAEQAASSRGPLVSFASCLWRPLADSKADRAQPVFERMEVEELGWFLAHLMSLVPSGLLRWMMQLPWVKNRLTDCPYLVPPIAMPFARVSPPRVTETIEARLEGPNGEAAQISASGHIRLDLALHASRVHAVARRYWRRLGPLDGVEASAGYLVLGGRPRLTWSPVQSETGIHPINHRVIALADLRTGTGMEYVLASAAEKAPSRTATLPLQAALPFDLPEVRGDHRIGKAMSVVASTPADATDTLLVSSVLRPEAKEGGLEELRLVSLALDMPDDYPRIDGAELQIVRLERSAPLQAHIHLLDTGSGVTLHVRQPEPLSVGEAVIVTLRFKSSIMHLGGRAAVRLEFRYRQPLSRLTEYRYAAPTGRLVHAMSSPGSAILPEGLTLRLAGDVDLSGLLFTTDERVQETVTAEDARFTPTMGFVRRLIELLADRQYVVRRVLESHPFTRGPRRAASFTCDIHGRLEESMASPDVHIRIHRDSPEPRTPMPPTQFDVTVVGKGKARTAEERERLTEVLKEICDTIHGGMTEALSVPIGSAARESEPPAACADTDPGSGGPAPRRTPCVSQDVVTRFEAALERLERFMDAFGTALSHWKRT